MGTFGFVSFICLVYTLVLGLALRVAQTEDLDFYQRAIYGVALFLVNVALILMTLHAMISNILESVPEKEEEKAEAAEGKVGTQEEQQGNGKYNKTDEESAGGI